MRFFVASVVVGGALIIGAAALAHHHASQGGIGSRPALPEVKPALKALAGVVSPGRGGDVDDARLSYDGLVAWWALDGGWASATGDLTLTPERAGGFAANDELRGAANRAYGPTGRAEGNGAEAQGLTELPTADGLTLAGWYFKPNNDTSGTLFGFGDHEWGHPSLGIYDRWGFLHVGAGATDEGKMIQYDRPSSGCWHHLALVVPPASSDGEAARLYVDGDLAAPLDGVSPTLPDRGLFGEPFRVGAFAGEGGGQMRVDEVSVWARALSPEEVYTLANLRATDHLCPGGTADWEPGPRCTFDAGGAIQVNAEAEVRVLSDDTIAVVTDPTGWLLSQMNRACGAYLTAMEDDAPAMDPWWTKAQYEYAWLETRARYWPDMNSAFASPGHFTVAAEGSAPLSPAWARHWPEPIREVTLPRAGSAEGESRTLSAQVVWVSYLKLAVPLRAGERYVVKDAWGNRIPFTYDLDQTRSWALKVDQLGYLADAPRKYAYLGAWLGQGGPMDLARFEGKPFAVVEEASGAVALTGVVRHRMDDPDYEGESVYQLDLSALTTPGRYYVRLPGAGRSDAFTLGQGALGEAFYVHARGLYHSRCGTDLTEPYTRWTRGDAHRIHRGGFPPEGEDYDDHSAEGWGFLDEDGRYVAYDTFKAVAATETSELIEGAAGGWHDAADYDRRPFHFMAVEDLVASYLMFPENFTDGQLNLPESGDGIPDILDEAIWGMDVWRQTQGRDGSASAAIEATSHPQEYDPGKDTQPYYLSLATRNSSLLYARHAAMLGRALTVAGRPQEAQAWKDSARAAYAFGTNPQVRVATSWEVGGETHRWVEPPSPDPAHRLWALIELWLATGDEAYRRQLDEPQMASTYTKEVGDLWWKYRLIQAAPLALNPGLFPAGWGDAARQALVSQAETWLTQQETHAYRAVWWAPTHGYFELSRWGRDGYMPIRALVAAWRVTGDSRYKAAALLGVNYHQGENGMGRVNTTGLGQHRAVAALHLPSWADDIDEPSPGITLFGNHVEMPRAAATKAWGLFVDPRESPPFEGLDEALLPPPWQNAGMTADGVQSSLMETMPSWRRLIALEQTLPSIMEFSVWETVSPAAAVTGCLMGPNWRPSQALRDTRPLDADALLRMSWIQP